MTLNFVILAIFLASATVSASELTFSKVGGNSYVELEPLNYALSGRILARQNIETVTLIHGKFVIIKSGCRTTTVDYNSIDDQLFELFDDLRKVGSSYHNNSSFEQNFIIDDGEKQLFRARISNEEPNHSLVALGRDIKSAPNPVSPSNPDKITRTIIDGNIITIVYDNQYLSMKPIACLTENEKSNCGVSQTGETLRRESLDELEISKRRLKVLQQMKQISYEEHESQMDRYNQLLGSFKNLERQIHEWGRVQTESYVQLRSKLERDANAWNENHHKQLEQLKSRLELDADTRNNHHTEQYQQLKGKFERDSASWLNQNNEKYDQLRNKLELDANTRNNHHTEQYQQLRAKFERDSEAWLKQNNEKYDQLRNKLELDANTRNNLHTEQHQQLRAKFERDSEAWLKQNNEKYDQLGHKLERESEARHKSQSEQYQQLRTKFERDSEAWLKENDEKYDQLRMKLERERPISG